MKFSTLYILLTNVLLMPVAKPADSVGKDLLNYFSSTCPSQGDWTKLVNADAEALISILDSIKNDPDCVSAAGSISQLGGLASKVVSNFLCKFFSAFKPRKGLLKRNWMSIPVNIHS